MTSEEFLTQIELDRSWREEEIRSMNNILIDLDKELDKNKLRRAIICLLYAHIEGFVKFSFGLYIESINGLKLKCQDVKPVLVAAVYHKDFTKLTDPDAKSKLFIKKAQEDKYIRKICLQEEFFERINDVLSAEIKIDDGYINTESNVGREVLEKLLYQVGLSHKSLNNTVGPLSKLLNKRNGIAHGIDKSVIDSEQYDEYFNCALDIMSELTSVLFLAYSQKDYLKRVAN
ncbi:hypothetical protein AB6H97_002732 [Providencia rettgeri]